MIGVVDETTPESAGVHYAVVSGLLLEDEATVRTALEGVLPPGRQRTFHWHTEGPVAKEAMVACLSAIHVVAKATVVTSGRKQLEQARAQALAATVEALLADGCTRLIIEARSGAMDVRDRGTILDVLRSSPSHPDLCYEWRPKGEPLLWIADAIGGGVREHLLGKGGPWFAKIEQATGITIDYLARNT